MREGRMGSLGGMFPLLSPKSRGDRAITRICTARSSLDSPSSPRWCQVCDFPFIARAGARYCGSSCRQRAYRARQRVLTVTGPCPRNSLRRQPPRGDGQPKNRRETGGEPNPRTKFGGAPPVITTSAAFRGRSKTSSRTQIHRNSSPPQRLDLGLIIGVWSTPSSKTPGKRGGQAHPLAYGRTPAERRIVRMVVALHRRGESFTTIRGWLAAEGLRPRTASRWWDTQLRRLIRRQRWSAELPPIHVKDRSIQGEARDSIGSK